MTKFDDDQSLFPDDRLRPDHPAAEKGPIRGWTLLAEEEILKTPVFTVNRHVCRSPKDGQDKNFVVMAVPDWVQVLAVTEDQKVLLVRQFRLGSRQISLELPGGVVEKGQTPLEAAQRELAEETGYTAANWKQLAAFRPNPAIQNNTAYLFLAEGARLTGSTDFDENEDLDLQAVSLDELRDLVFKGTIDHAIMVAGIMLYLNSINANEVKL